MESICSNLDLFIYLAFIYLFLHLAFGNNPFLYLSKREMLFIIIALLAKWDLLLHN